MGYWLPSNGKTSSLPLPAKLLCPWWLLKKPLTPDMLISNTHFLNSCLTFIISSKFVHYTLLTWNRDFILFQSMTVFLLIAGKQCFSPALGLSLRSISEIIYDKKLTPHLLEERELEAYRAIGQGFLLMSLMLSVGLPAQCNATWSCLK